MRSGPGTYALILRCDTHAQIRVGRHGLVGVRTGYYVYVGSAFGPGGVRARVSRHVREKATRHWHIDYLRTVAAPVAAWWSDSTRELEHRWARILSGLPGSSPVPRFGSSDCDCESHLFRFVNMPDLERFAHAAGGLIESCSLENNGH
ncbi:MAG: hypothetical protein AMJ66_02235 [Betaproteobacteria bacterium SG8_40]|nr:MAG: hypothetical protein AMJ66_02235 [Betaproteobacteria bacterium SG8_40]